ncbi:RHS repeat-associated core domain-containing protein [Microvirga pakistanensis]|uniref:RHS repeat-associated core domain-containing protein n=1 Tax=Microvirga pakistanensis TaxID=1682650 RepID=UPI00106C2DD2|nr:RHS repeat-associated core domain-containing protein [Microvirga pakistanensis]
MSGPTRIESEQIDLLARQLQRRQILGHFRRLGIAVEPSALRNVFHLRDAENRSAQVAFRDDGAVQTRSAAGRITTYRFNAEGELVGRTEPGGLVVTSEVEPATGARRISRQGYGEFRICQDPFGLPEAIEYPDGTSVRFDQDRPGGEGIHDQADQVTICERDEDGEVTAIIDRNGCRTDMVEIVEEGRRTLQVTQADGTRNVFVLGSEGGLKEWWVNGACVATYAMGEGPLPESANFADGHWVRFEKKDGRIVTAESPNSRVSLIYDAAGRLVEEDQNGIKVRYQRDRTGLLTAIVLPDGEWLGFAYDGDGRLAKVRDWSGAVTTLAWAPTGQMSNLSHPNGVSTAIQSNPLGLVTEARTTSTRTETAVCALAYQYDAMDRVIAMTEDGAARHFRYDPVGRLTAVEAPDPALAEAWTLDPMGNRRFENGAPVSVDCMNRVTGGAAGAARYDALGRTIAVATPRGPAQLSYNGQGQLVRAEIAGRVVAEYAYDAFGRRISKKVNGRVTRYLWAGQSLLCEWAEGGEGPWTRRDHLVLPDLFVPLAMRVDGRIYRQHTDHRGAPLAMTDESGAVVWRAKSKAFGEAVVLHATVTNPWRLPGQYRDDETGLHYNLARYYYPSMGRYLTFDPAFDPSGGGNFYLYAAGDPINGADPTGEILPIVAAILIGAAIGAVMGAAFKAWETRGQPWDANRWSEIGKGALIGGAIGALSGAVGFAVAAGLGAAGMTAAAGIGTAMGVGAIEGAVTSVVETCAEAAYYDRAVSNEDLLKNALLGAGMGAVTAGVGGVFAARAARKAAQEAAEKAAKEAAEKMAQEAAEKAAKRARLNKHKADVDAQRATYEKKLSELEAAGASRKAKAHPKRKITEAKGERAAADLIEKNHPELEMVQGFKPGTGFDQVYVKKNPDGSVAEYVIVEAKGPGATLSKNAKKGEQMSQDWVRRTVDEMRNSSDAEKRKLGSELRAALFTGSPPVRGKVIQADDHGIGHELPCPNGGKYN